MQKVVFLKKAEKVKKVFSTANLFFICLLGTFIFGYFYFLFGKTFVFNPTIAIVSPVVALVAFPICFYFKFPLFVKTENDSFDISIYENVYSKNISFLAKIYIGIFYWTKISNTISLFTMETLKFGYGGRNSKFILNSGVPKFIHRFLDILLTLVCTILAFLISKEFSRFGILFGFLSAVLIFLTVYKKVLLNHIYSVNIGKHEGYNLNVMYKYSQFDGIFSNVYGLAYDIPKTILIHESVFSGKEELKKYILTHEEGHLATRSSKKSFWLTFIFIVTGFVGIASPTVISEIWPTSELLVWIPTVLFLLFLYIFDFIIQAKNKEDELKADAYAIKKIGKTAVLDGLSLIKNDNSYNKLGFKLSGILIDRRIQFVQEYDQQ